MTTALDTNIITALWNEDDALNRTAQDALDKIFGRDSLVISGLVYAELLAAPRRTGSFVDQFCDQAGIDVEWELNERIFRLAGEALRGYADRRRKQIGVEPRRILADFLIGAHATVNGYKLLTMDAGVYRAGFPRLAVVEV
jgi:predicted nucleic acid-binding protein